jgi:hypothetical protein
MPNTGHITNFTGQENHLIPLAEAAVLTAAYRQASPLQIIGGFFGADAIQSILTQPLCVGIRYYYGLQPDGTPVMVMVGADANMNDLYQGVIIEMSMPCPKYCSVLNPLNSDI